MGQTLTDANAEVERLKLTGAVIDHTTSDRYPKNVVILQRPDAGTAVREGRQISFVISDGIVARLMPDLRYQSMREVNLDLSRSKLQLGKVTYVKSDVIPDGHVISQDPSPLSSVAEGDVVNLTVSRGGVSQLHVPNFVGMKVDQARALADKDNIKLGQIVWTPLGRTGPPHGQVVLQLPKAGVRVAPYDQISLQVSSGPYESGYIIRQVRLLVSVPVPDSLPNGKQLDVRLTVTDATGKYDLYRAFAEPGQKLDLAVTAVGTSVVDMYVNDELVGETRLGAEPAAIYDMKPSPQPSNGGP